MTTHPESQPVLGRLDHWAGELDRLSREYSAAVLKLAQVRIDYERAHAAAILRAEGRNVQEREANALVDMEERGNEWATYMEARAKVDSLAALIKNAMEQVAAAQSHNAAVNTALRGSAYGG